MIIEIKDLELKNSKIIKLPEQEENDGNEEEENGLKYKNSLLRVYFTIGNESYDVELQNAPLLDKYKLNNKSKYKISLEKTDQDNGDANLFFLSEMGYQEDDLILHFLRLSDDDKLHIKIPKPEIFDKVSLLDIFDVKFGEDV